MTVITIVGSGNIGRGLGRAWARAGHEVVFAVRDPGVPALQPLLRETGAIARPLAEALAESSVVVLAVPFGAVPAVAAAIPSWAGKVVVDSTNAIGPGFTLLYGHTDSGAEVNARLLKGSRLVKSFSAQGAEILSAPAFGAQRASNFYCGDDAQAKALVRGLIEDVGFEPVDLGGLQAARALEPMTLVWLAAAKALGSRHVAFKLLSDKDTA